MSAIEWYWFVYAPLGVVIFGSLLAGIGVWLIEWASRRRND